MAQAQALQRARGLAHWRKLMEAAAWQVSNTMGWDDSSPHWWRPPHENSRILARAARAAGVDPRQLRVKEPLRFVYDEQAEVPLHLLPSTPTNVLWASSWAGNFARKKLDDYQISEVLQHIYAQERRQVVKAGGDGGPELFSECRSGPVMLKTFQKAGSLAFMEFGTCLVKGKYVVVDAGPWFKLKLDAAQKQLSLQLQLTCPVYRGYVCSTESCLLTVPKPAFDASAYRLLKAPKLGEELFKLPGGKLAKMHETLRFQLNREREIGLEVGDEFGGQAAVKVAVEIDMTMLGKGNIAFFEPAQVADDAGKVWDRLQQLDKSVVGCSLSGLKLHKLEIRTISSLKGIFTRAYLLIPEFLDPEKDVPFKYDAFYIY